MGFNKESVVHHLYLLHYFARLIRLVLSSCHYWNPCKSFLLAMRPHENGAITQDMLRCLLLLCTNLYRSLRSFVHISFRLQNELSKRGKKSRKKRKAKRTGGGEGAALPFVSPNCSVKAVCVCAYVRASVWVCSQRVYVRWKTCMPYSLFYEISSCFS